MDPMGIARVALVTDFGPGVYLGQMRARLSVLVPDLPVIDLVQDLPPFRPDLAAYLLPALMRDMPKATLYLCVVDPGVGGARSMLLVESDGDWLLGPDNGLLSRVAHRGREVRAFRIGWQPQALSASFHGRDWIAPAAARLCQDQPLGLMPLERRDLVGSDWADERPAVVYGDRYGNLMCGLRAAAAPLGPHTRIRAAGRVLGQARTFCEVPVGEPFWYENALGLVEIAVNRGRVDRVLGLAPGDAIELLGDEDSEAVRV